MGENVKVHVPVYNYITEYIVNMHEVDLLKGLCGKFLMTFY